MFVDEYYEKVEKVYSIWICPDPAKKRKNGIFKYHTVEDIIYGESYTKEENYDLMEVVVLNLGDADKSSDLEILELGREERNISMAQMMIQEREPIEKIEKYTGYTLEKLREIATKIGIPLMTE